MRFVSLFAGVGGFDLGFEAAGMECVGQVEIDKHARSVLDKHWPNVPKHDDVVTAIEWAKEIGLNGKVDLVCGGFPCQDLSVAGKRLGFAGERSSLFYSAIEFAQAVGAKQVVLENVPGLFSSNGGADFVAVINTLRESGFSYVEWRVFDSQFYGVPQRRRRIYIVASVGEPNRFPVFVESNSGSRDSESQQEKGKATSTGIRDGIVGSLCASDSKGLNNQGVDQGKYVIGKASFGDFKVRPLAGALTTAGDRPMTFENETVRRLTPTEFERLQGFPDGWTAEQTDGHRYKQMGNAVTVNVTKAVGQMIMEANK